MRSIELNREDHPVLTPVVASAILTLFLLLVVVLSPLLVVMHFALRVAGRKGLVFDEGTSVSFVVGPESFARR